MPPEVKLQAGERALMYVILLLCATAFLSLVVPFILFAARALASNNSTVMLNGAISLLGVNIMMVTGALAYIWFRPHIKEGFKLDRSSLVITLITLYALSRVCTSVEPLFYPLSWLIQYIPHARAHLILRQALEAAFYLSGIIVGLLILKLSSSLIRKPSIDNQNKRLVALSLLGLSLSAIFFTVRYAVWYATLGDVSLLLFELVPYILAYLSICYLAFNVNKRGMLDIKQLLAVFLVWIFSSLFVYFLQLRFEFFEEIPLMFQIWRMLKGSYILYESIGLTAPIIFIRILAAVGIVLSLRGYEVGRYPKTLLSSLILLYALDNLISSTNIFYLNNIITFASNFLSTTIYLISGTDIDTTLLNHSSQLGISIFSITQGIIILTIGIITLKKTSIKPEFYEEQLN